MDLTFAEQVKIVLGRKNMTIKQLAEEIQEKTGHKMSRQNLTQRLGRDNFQEQDMRMIAEILGCPFQLNILEAAAEEDGERLFEIRRKADMRAQKREEKNKAESESAGAFEEESGNDVTVGDMLDMLESVAESEISGDGTAYPAAEAKDSTAEAKDPAAEEKDPTAEAEEALTEAESLPADDKDMQAETGGSTSGAGAEVPDTESGQEQQNSEASGGMEQEQTKKEKKIPKWEPKPVEKKTDRSSIWNRREEKLRKKKESHPHGDWIGATPQSRSKDFLKDVAENGEINPYTGREYETNSVRMHPKRIGYIQVYDRGNHKWTDMTEWAFYGFQEQKKSLLGPDYDEPIYLD